MNQIRRKRRMSPLEAAVLGNILYIVIVLIFKSIFDVIRTDDFNFLFNSVQLLTIGIFWVILFTFSFKNISAGEKPKVFKYIFYSLIPIAVLTVSLTAVSLLAPGQDTNSIWNQFAFLAAPTIFWYLPYGLIYQLMGSSFSIFIFFGIALILTMVFQVIGIILGRVMGHKYWEETKEEDERERQYDMKPKNEKKKTKKKSKLPKRASIGMDGLSNERINEGFTPEKSEIMNMTEVIIGDPYQNEEDRKGYRNGDRDKDRLMDERISRQETGLFEKMAPVEELKLFSAEKTTETGEAEIKPAAMPEADLNKTAKSEQADTIDEWKVTHPVSSDSFQEELKKHEETRDKSFLKETSAIRIINEEDIEEYYRNKK